MTKGETLTRRQFLKNAAVVVMSVAGGVSGAGLLAEAVYLRDQRAINRAKEKLDSLGLTGDLQLIDLRTIPGFNVNGGFSFGTGNFNGETKSIIQFAWKTKLQANPQVIISEVPLDRVIFNVDNGQEVSPHVNFIFNSLSVANTHSDNPNDYIKNALTVTFTLSEKDFYYFRGTQATPQP